jgi:hypothetical protein
MNPQSLTPKHLMILAVVGFSIVSFLAYHWLSQPILTAANVTQFSGVVKQARVFSGKNAYLEITLENHRRLEMGAFVSLGVATSEASAPRRNWAQNQPFFEFITMSIGSDDALTLDAHNKSVESNKKVGPWFCLGIAVVCVCLFWLGYRHRASSGSIAEILKAKK